MELSIASAIRHAPTSTGCTASWVGVGDWVRIRVGVGDRARIGDHLVSLGQAVQLDLVRVTVRDWVGVRLRG